MAILPQVKGLVGELQGRLAGGLFLDDKVYRSVHNVTLQMPDGTTQIDHVIVSRYGVFVVETKNYSGWIYGSERDAQWTQVLFGKKVRFQNPLRQNYRHVASLATFLDLPEGRFHSVVMFWGDCELKTPMPPNVMTSGYATYIKSKSAPVFTDEEVEDIVEAVRRGRLPPTWKTHRAHVASLRKRHDNSTSCPKCGSPLVERRTTKGRNAGTSFFGCSSYPKCRFVQAASGAPPP